MARHEKATNGLSLAEANALVPRVVELTEQTKDELRRCRFPWQALGVRKFNVLHQLAQEDCVYMKWATAIARLGAVPKGRFTVDFPSQDSETVFCWGDGETEITHEHKVWENFSHRRPINGG